ncbi:hypothetical protein BGX26_000418 [Mortierella sp. AD094]|nr:hypothetical protein BGX26_000418 [Mortierella sp. AD094]
MTRMVGTRKEEFARMKRHHDAFQANTWDAQNLEPEPRVCLLLNRFTRNLIIMYSSSACEKVLHTDADDITDKPILLYIRSDDLASFVEQMDIVKRSSSIVSMKFYFQSPNQPREIPCEAIFIGASDAILTIIRRYKPFVRKYFIGSHDHFASSGQVSSTQSSYSSSSSSFLSYSSRSSKVSKSALNKIRMCEIDDDSKDRPMTCTPDNDPHLVNDSEVMSQLSGFKKMITHDHYDSDNEENNDNKDSDDNDDNIVYE